MTHTLHRVGTCKDLEDDFPVLCIRAKGYNDEGSHEKLAQFLRIAMKHKPVNIGTTNVGNMYSHKAEDVIVKADGVVNAVFTDPESVVAVLRDVKEADLGMSVVVSGLIDVVEDCCNEAGLRRHTVEFSLGIWGNTSKLPPEEVLQVTTMCGHGRVASNLVQQMVEDVRKGSITAGEAGKRLAAQCCCGVFNPVRAARILTAMARGS